METNSYRSQRSGWPKFRMLMAACVAVAALTASAGEAAAQNPAAINRAKAFYARAKAAYKAKDFKLAIELYLKAFEEYPNPIFHYNVAESYKQLLDCPHTLHYYKRYLSASKKLPPVKRRVELEKRARELIDLYSQRCKEASPTVTVKPKVIKKPKVVKKPKVIKKPKGDDDDDDDDDDTGDDDTGVGGVTKGAFQPTMLHVSAAAGPSFVSLGNNDTPVLFSINLGLGYPIKLGTMSADVGAVFSLTSVPWEGGGNSGTALLSSILANAGVNYAITPKLSLRGELGLGVEIFSGLGDGNPFIPNGKMATGALSVLNVRVALGASYSFTDNIVAYALPVVFAYSPAPDGLTDDITSLSRFELLFGLGYRM